ncbi:unnamed protein product [Pleuronectes platessa]|uniref:Uncharacterized protein n=1 Tax=Pleuronectes platessa TaxID=8262 RepID=A0A9N7Y7Z6_PLEPL|nr:unnamed protein product [Pleuronectes platessa]
MLLHSVLLLIALSCCCSAAGDHHDNGPKPMMMGAAQSPDQSHDNPTAPSSASRQEDPQADAMWRSKVLDLLTELVLVQREAAKHQGEVVQLLGMLGTQGSQQIQDLQNVARHQSLLVENHQALLLQTSRIATHLHDITKKPAAAVQ